MARLLIAAGSILLAVALFGCGSPGPAPAPALSVAYIKISGVSSGNQADVLTKLALVPDCNYQGLGDDSPNLYKSVDMKCCQLSTWTDAGVTAGEGTNGGVTFSSWDKAGKAGDDTVYSCPVGDLGDLQGYPTWVRGHQGCNGVQVAYAEACVPLAINMSNNEWPMMETVAQNYWESGTYESCHCHEVEQLGDKCFVGKTFPGFAFFGLSKGDAFCSSQLKAEVV